MDNDDLSRFGPKMRALTPKQRGYVMAQLSDPLGNPTQWARDAGYSDHKLAAKVTGHHLAHDDRMIEAIREEARRHADTVGPTLGIGVMMQIARNPEHPHQLRAAEMLLDRVGFGVVTEHKVSVEHTDRTGVAMVERIRQLAAIMGVDERRLLGPNAGGDTAKVIEGTGSRCDPVEVADAASNGADREQGG